MKRILLSLIACGASLFCAKAQQVEIQLWGDNSPVTFQCHVEGDGGSYGKMTADHSLDFWDTEGGGIDMRQTYEVFYTKGRPSSGEYIYHGKREGNKIIFSTYEDPYGINADQGIMPIDKEYAPYILEIISPKQLKWDGIVYNKMKYDYATNKWVRD